MVFDLLMDIILAMLLIGCFNFVRSLLRVRKMLKKYKDDPSVEGITIVNGEVKVIQKKQNEAEMQIVPKEMVEDEVCNTKVEKDKAYRVVKDGVEHFFCSWECRQKFLENSHHQ